MIVRQTWQVRRRVVPQNEAIEKNINKLEEVSTECATSNFTRQDPATTR
jgi:hypothetical protein